MTNADTIEPAPGATPALTNAAQANEVLEKAKEARIRIPTEPKFNSHPVFPLAIETLQELTDNRDHDLLEKLGGVEGLAKHLKTHLEHGLVGDEVVDAKGGAALPQDAFHTGHDLLPEGHTLTAFKARRNAYGTNFLPSPPPPSFFMLCWEQLQDRMLRVLLLAAIVSITVGLYMKYSGIGDPNEWIEGVAILCTVAFVVLINAGNDYKKAKQFQFLSSQRGLTSVITVTRRVTKDAEPAQATIPVMHLQVGDIVHLATGDVVPADGVFLSGHQCKTDESSVTGETDAVSKKVTGDRYLISGSKVIEGICTYLVTAVGQHSLAGRSMMALRTGETEFTPLQIKLQQMANLIAYFGGSAAAIIVVVSLIKFFVVFAPNGFTKDFDGTDMDGGRLAERVIKIFITGVTVIVVSIPEGLPMAVTLALGYATIRMLKDQNLVRVLAACETMGGATTICSDKTGTLTQNKMTVVQGTFFDGGVVFDTQEQIRDRMMAGEVPAPARQVLAQSININSTAYEGVDEAGVKTLVGSKTECALLEFTSLLATTFNLDRQAAEQVGVIPFSSDRKRMSTVIDKAQTKAQEISFNVNLPAGAGAEAAPITQGARMFTKGASELILQSCRWLVDAQGRVVPMTAERRKFFEDQILAYATNALRTIGMAYMDIPVPEAGAELSHDLDMDNLVWLGVAGIEDPLRPEVPPAVSRCQDAGIIVRMVTGDNAVTARNIAKRCNILTDEKNDIVMEGAQFRQLPDAEMKKMLPRLRVLARSSPLDKQILVNQLKEMGETVAVTGDGTNDAPALKAADVGFAMGIAGTEVAKEASDIILLDDNFSSIVRACMWGRSVYDAVRKFLQFQLSVNLTAVGLAMVTATADPKSRTVVSAVQLLWINLIMDTAGALALATDPPHEGLLDRKPHKKSDPLISYPMAKMMVSQSFFALTGCLILTFLSESWFNFGQDAVLANPENYYLDVGPESPRFRAEVSQYILFRKSAIVFNGFVWATLFNILNARMLYQEYNIFKRINKNPLYLMIWAGIAIVQVLIVQFGYRIFSVVPLSLPEWGLTVAMGSLALPVAVITKSLPDIGRQRYELWLYGRIPESEYPSQTEKPEIGLLAQQY